MSSCVGFLYQPSFPRLRVCASCVFEFLRHLTLIMSNLLLAFTDFFFLADLWTMSRHS